jgi:hypothetical protein
MPEKSYVTLEACPICRKETGTLLLDRRLRDVFEMHTINPASVCKACREQYLKEGIMLINPHTGSLVVIKEEAYKRLTNKPVPEGRIAFAEEEVLTRMMVAQKKASDKKLKEVV